MHVFGNIPEITSSYLCSILYCCTVHIFSDLRGRIRTKLLINMTNMGTNTSAVHLERVTHHKRYSTILTHRMIGIMPYHYTYMYTPAV